MFMGQYSHVVVAQVHEIFDRILADRKFEESVQQLEAEKLKRRLMLSELQVQGLQDTNASLEAQQHALSAELQRMYTAHRDIVEKLVSQQSVASQLAAANQEYANNMQAEGFKVEQLREQNAGLREQLQAHQEQYASLELRLETTAQQLSKSEVCVFLMVC